MLTLIDILSRVRAVLNDPDSLRFSDEVLVEGVKHAMQRLNECLPQELEFDFVVTASGRDQALSGMTSPLYLMQISIPGSPTVEEVFEPELHFSYRMQDGQPVVHFTGELIPQAGCTLRVAYAAPQTLAALDGAASTTLPETAFTALVNGAAGHACLLRAHTLLDNTGVRPGEVDRLLHLAQLRLDLFEKNLADLRIFQEFGFPRGFPLDQWDTHHQEF